jgi:hypothetical protein
MSFWPKSMSAIGMRELRRRLSGTEFDTLTDAQQVAVIAAIQQCSEGRSTVSMADGGEAYAYPHPGGGIAWGFNSGETGFCIARGITEG